MSDTEYILKLFPEIELIKNKEIRDKTIEVWLRVWKKSKWKKIEDCVYNPMIPINISNLVNHTRVVTKGCIELAKIAKEIHGVGINLDFLIAASNLHDVCKLLEYELKDGKAEKTELGDKFVHGFFGAITALEVGLDPDIAHLISIHTSGSVLPPKPPMVREGTILHNVDMIDTDFLRSLSNAPLIYKLSLSKVTSAR